MGASHTATLVSAYLSALERADLDAVLKLFVPGATVHSPLYGTKSASEFFPEVFADTSRAELHLRGVMEGRGAEGQRLVSFWFRYDWWMASGTPAPFDVVDLAELGDDGRITTLRIVYDTVDVRPKYEAELAAR
ncbi:nuclear transport factor 2 family protein [Yinghuangia soli]|uniref:Nuclear transport factor 2 family protein n=1 Tax=Yinghuangia soli TaxID=2908204 RepID=A0AA41PYK9_9ACTN|nr:nuclear transport factor 2 family protein [Yinghuangia soli]MCF2528293.1 nuclear transport factor 2 family protein [Yinghuangia soli]